MYLDAIMLLFMVMTWGLYKMKTGTSTDEVICFSKSASEELSDTSKYILKIILKFENMVMYLENKKKVKF